MFTRKQYLNDECTHRQYYAQFVTVETVKLVTRRFGLAELKKAFSKDEAFNTIALPTWDALGYALPRQAINAQMKELGDYLTPAGTVCILKEAARQATGY